MSRNAKIWVTAIGGLAALALLFVLVFDGIWLKPMVRPERFSWAMLTEVKAVARLAARASLEMMVTMSSRVAVAACSPATMTGRYIKYYYM